MRDTDLFEQALGLKTPWRVERSIFSPSEKRLAIHIDFEPGGTFACPEGGRSGCKAWDTSEKTWRHLNVFEHEAPLHARVPRVRCSECGVKQASVPWAWPGSGFTRLFEAFVLTLVREMPVAAAARMLGEHDTRLWRVLHHYIEEVRESADFSAVRHVGMDETASKRAHNYISLFVDLEERLLRFATEGRDSKTVERFRKDREAHAGRPERIREFSLDMSPHLREGHRAGLPRGGRHVRPVRRDEAVG